MSLQPGSRLGPYEIVSPLGAGGMGEVYRARDMRLARDVAIKILPEAFASDPERLARFAREAQLLAALNHPHIAQIYGLEEGPPEGGPHETAVGSGFSRTMRALVMELVDGETLADRIARGPMPVDEALAIARQIADALEAAHERGIVHRDLKPANIKVSDAGAVKVLDFGLAKLADADRGRPTSSISPTITSPAMATGIGMLLGTAAYMAPEQARGKSVDKRADIWALGVIVYEMVTGERPFAGDTITDVLASVVKDTVDLKRVPPGAREIVRACLEKDPAKRLRDVGDLPLVTARVETADAVPLQKPVRARVFWLAAVIAAAIGGVALGRFALAPAKPALRPVRFEIGGGAVSSAVLSPDGSRLAIASRGPLVIRDLARLETHTLDQTDGATRPFWSPDGQTIAYGARGKLWKIAATGGAPVAICDLVGGLWDDDAGGAWLADGNIVYSNGNAGLWQVSAQGGDPVEVLKPDPKRELHFHTGIGLPDGRSFVYVVHRPQGVDTMALWADGKASVVLQTPGQAFDDPAYSPSGHLLFQRNPTNAGVWAVPFSLKTRAVTGEPFLVAPGMRGPNAAADGSLVVLPPRRATPVAMMWMARDGAVPSRIDEARFRRTNGAVSPEGDRIAVSETTDGKSDIWLYDLRRNTRTRLTNDGTATDPVWTRDGKGVIYNLADARGQGDAARQVAADGSGRTTELGAARSPVPSADGSTLFYVLPDNTGWRLWYRSLANRDAKPALFVNQSFYAVRAAPSPDGHFVAYEAESGPAQSDVYLRRFPPTDEAWQVSAGGGTFPRWSPDGHLYYAKGPDIYEVEIATSPEVRIGAPVHVLKRAAAAGGTVPAAFDVAPDGKRFLTYETVAGTPTDERITVVLNWFSEFAK